MVDNNNFMYRNITNQKVVDFMNTLYFPQDEEMERFRAEAEADRVPIVQRDAEKFLTMMVGLVQPKNILEVGTAVGYSGACMLKAFPGSDLYTFEKNEESFEKAKANFEKLGLADRVHLFLGDADAEIRKLPEDLMFDFAFIDAAKGHYRDFTEAALPHMRHGGDIVCDNMLFQGRVVSDEYDPTGRYKTEVKKLRQFVDWLFERKDLETRFFSVGDGITVTKVMKKQG